MKFNEIPYSRVTAEYVHEETERFIAALNNAKSAAEAETVIRALYDEQNDFETNISVAMTRFSIDTKDEFYKAENDYYDENMPQMQLDSKRQSDAIYDSPYRAELEKSLGTLLFRKIENERRLITPEVIPYKQEENRLQSRYDEILGGAEIEFDGKTLNLTQLDPYRQSPDRAVRKAATEAYFTFFAERQAELDEIFAQLVKLRDKIAKTLGFPSGVELGYAQMERFDYDESMVKVYRDEVKRHIVPLVVGLKERQRKRVGVDKLKFYDNTFLFKTGNPVPHGTPDELVALAQTMYRELAPEAGEFFDFMVENELMDLIAKPGKMTGGYCTSFSAYKSPFIFANFTGTKDDVDVLTHEAGHALQGYLSMREIPLPPYWSPTYESCEIHSMSMELLTRPWMEGFFKEDTEKFLYQQLEDILNFLPYGCLVDDFQHHVYHNPDESPDERAAAWRALEREYMPFLDFDGYEYLENGRRWQRQAHIYERPFYYIDYTLAQVCAMQFFLRAHRSDPNTLSDYLKLCRAGGTRTFVALVEYAGLRSPFEKDVLSGASQEIKAILDETDDSKL